MRFRALLSASLFATATGIAFAAQPREGVEVLVSADAIEIPEGFRPKPGKPIYYLLAESPIELGDSIAGVKLPDKSFVEGVIVAELKKQGFIRAEVGGPMPSICLLATWGAANFEMANDADIEFYLAMVPPDKGGRVLTEDERRAEAARMAYINSPRARDKPAIAAIVGAGKVAAPTGDGLKVLTAANENRLYLSLAALDALLFAKKEKKLLWRTSMSIDWRNDFGQALRTMLASGGPLFGTNNTEPVFLDDRDRRNAQVKIGDATVVPETAPIPAAPVKK